MAVLSVEPDVLRNRRPRERGGLVDIEGQISVRQGRGSNAQRVVKVVPRAIQEQGCVCVWGTVTVYHSKVLGDGLRINENARRRLILFSREMVLKVSCQKDLSGIGGIQSGYVLHGVDLL